MQAETNTKKIYILKQVGFGAVAYNEDENIIKAKYMQETENNKYAGYFIKEVTVPSYMLNRNRINEVDFWNYLSLIK